MKRPPNALDGLVGLGVQFFSQKAARDALEFALKEPAVLEPVAQALYEELEDDSEEKPWGGLAGAEKKRWRRAALQAVLRLKQTLSTPRL